MPIVPVILTIVIVGVIMWIVNTYVPMSAPIKQVLNIVVVILLCIWLINLFGLFSYTLPVRHS